MCKHTNNCLNRVSFSLVNFIAIIVADYRQCYEESSFCLITNTAYGSKLRNWSSAEDWCKNHSSSLVNITNEKIQSAITAFINDSSVELDSVVITNGYRYILSDWRWTNNIKSSECYICTYILQTYTQAYPWAHIHIRA